MAARIAIMKDGVVAGGYGGGHVIKQGRYGGTAGGIKVTTFAVLAVLIWSELRGDRTRPCSTGASRSPPSVALHARAALGGDRRAPDAVDDGPLAVRGEAVLFEVTSAFSTTGLSTGITADLAWYPPSWCSWH